MFQTIVNAFKIKEIRRKMLITIGLIFVYLIGCRIPVPGVESFDFAKVPFFQLMSMASGQALSMGTFFAMGIGPYINASIIIQLLTVAIPALERMSKQGEEGRRKINNITRVVTLVLSIAQAIGILLAFGTSVHPEQIFGGEGFRKVLSYAFLVLIYATGSALTMWIGERITEYGVSNGISMLIFTGIITTLGYTLINFLKGFATGDTALSTLWQLLGFVLTAIFIFAAVVTVDSAERKISVQYAKQVKGRKMYGGQSTHIPIKVNSSGVMPLIFAYSIISFPELIMSMIGKVPDWWQNYLSAGTWLYMVVLCVLILFFAYFYNQIQFNPDDISKSIQGNGGFIPGIRPGKPTADYLKKISNRITLFGAIFLALVALIPTMVFKAIDPTGTLVNAFSATGLLILVSVSLEFEQALQSQIMMKNYRGFLK